MADLTQVQLPNGVTYDLKDSTKLPLAGGTMTGQIKTSFKSSIATGSYGASASTIPDLCTELRYSSGVMGSVSISTSYTKDGVTIATGWYNFLWVPHRSGGVNGQASGDNCDYGSLYLSGMTTSGCYMLRFASGNIAELRDLYKDTNTTYTFANGTNGFTVTPSGGSAQTVTVTPSIANNVTGSGTSGYIAKFNGGNTITNGPALGSSTTTFLRNDGQWATPASGGNKIFTVTPTTPYSVGDLYIEDDNNIYVCNTARSSGSYVSDDWDGAVDAIDNDTMENYVDSVLANAFGTNGGNVLWRLDANGKPYEFLVTDTPGNLNGKIWRWDGNGLRFSSSGYSGSYITLINSNGRFVADYLTGTFNASNLTIQNFSAALISGGVFTRGNSSNNSGTIVVKDSSSVTIAEVDNAGFKFYGAGNVGSRPYFIFNNSVGFAGYNASGALTFQISTDEFHIQKLYADAQLTIGGYLKAVPVNNGTNKGISFVKAY